MHSEFINWTGWADGYDGQWRAAANYPTDPWGEYFDDSQQVWAFNLSGIAQRYPGWYLNGLYLETWSRKKKHSERHLVRVRDYVASNGIQPNPNSQPWDKVIYSGNLADGQYIWTSKNGVRAKYTTHWFYNPIPIERYLSSALYISIQGDPNSRREYGHIYILAFNLFRYLPGYPNWSSTVLAGNYKAVPGWNSQVVSGNWLSSFAPGTETLP